MTLAVNCPEFGGKRGEQRMTCRDHLGAGQPSLGRKGIDTEMHKCRHEQKEPAAARMKAAWCQLECTNVRDNLTTGQRTVRAFFVEPARQSREARHLEDLPNTCRTERGLTLLECLADLVDRVVALSELNDGIAGCVLERLGAWSTFRRDKELRSRVVTKLVAQDTKGTGSVAKCPSDIRRRAALHEESTQGLIGAMFGRSWHLKELGTSS
jgi:hypothetical protein